jgi:hypothetical protein
MITVHSRQRGVDPDVAPVDVLAVLSVVDDPATVAAPPPETAVRAPDRQLRGQVRQSQSTSRQRAFTIKAEARTTGGGVFVRQAIVELTGDRDQPITVHQWEQARSRLSVGVSQAANP